MSNVSPRCFLFSILCLLLTLGPLIHAQPAGRKLAVVVGVQKYDHDKLVDLDYTERDASELTDRLTRAGFTVVLLSTAEGLPASQRPTFQQIDAKIKESLRGITKRDIILVAMSGHGIQFDDSDENFFCPLDANPVDKLNLYSLKGLLNWMDASGAGTKLLLVDACRDAPRLPRNAKGISGDEIRALPSGVSALFSCAERQISYETPEAGGGHGIFMHAVLEGLDGEAANRDGEISWSRLVAHVQETVPKRAMEWIGPRVQQNPHGLSNLINTPILARVTVTRPSSPPREEMRRPSSETGANSKSIASQTTGAKLLLIPAGEFLMGSPETDTAAGSDEKPQHRVEITKPFYMGETEVTQKQWRVVMGTEPWKGKEHVQEGDDHAATYVSWDDALEYCKRLSEKDGRTYRLPSEAEWEYACRAGTQTKWNFGDSEDELGKYAWNDGNADSAGEDYAHRVGQKKANAWGLRDMHGNVWEWCNDWYGVYTSGPVSDPQGPSEGSDRVRRGGGWYDVPGSARSADRYWYSPDVRSGLLGFRLASSSE